MDSFFFNSKTTIALVSIMQPIFPIHPYTAIYRKDKRTKAGNFQTQQWFNWSRPTVLQNVTVIKSVTQHVF